MRELIISELAKDLLGPKDGPNEPLHGDGPRQSYVTGVLAPENLTPDITTQGSGRAPTAQESNEDLEISINGEISPPMDPKDVPSTMGISFFVESDKPEFSVCVTWARYEPTSFRANGRANSWVRRPRPPFIEKISSGMGSPITISHNNNHELELWHSIDSKPDVNNKRSVSVRIKNIVSFQNDDENKQQFDIFQPEIRIVCEDGTKIVPGFDPKFTDNQLYQSEIDEKRLLEILYRKRKIFAKGHLVSAVWNDPEGHSTTDHQADKPDKSKLNFPDVYDKIPFVWTDGGAVTDPRFKRPDVRTEFLPLYSIPKPEQSWNEINQKSGGGKFSDEDPELRAAVLAEVWDVADIRNNLSPLCNGYEQWIVEMKSSLSEFTDQEDVRITSKMIAKCENTLERMRGGIELLCTDPMARLAFCFANKAVDMQYGWKYKDEQNNPRQFSYYPFQIAFILSTIESIVKSDIPEREVCDLLWVPTGGGKTEAYLVLTAFLLAYRRRREISSSTARDRRTGDGVAVITRYTLRLLSVQQFRRMLAIIMSCEKLRVQNQGTNVGWRPADSQDTGMIWGSVPFSLGLWLGTAMTPNHLEGNNNPRNQHDGALQHLMEHESTDPHGRQTWTVRRSSADGGDPCQVTNCPACDAVLSIPTSDTNPGMKGEKEIFLTLRANDAEIDTLRNGLTTNTGIFEIEATSPADTKTDDGFTVFALSVRTLGAAVTPYNFHEAVVECIRNSLGINGREARRRICSVTADKPGYFFRRRKVTPANDPAHWDPYDFEIICPNPDCDLAERWFAGAPHGSIHQTEINRRVIVPLAQMPQDEDGITLRDGNHLNEVQDAFSSGTGGHVSKRITIGAYTVDDQIYGKTPSVIIATVDKFARPPFGRTSGSGWSSRANSAGNIFGNVTGHHPVHGYYRIDAGTPRTNTTTGVTTGGFHPMPNAGHIDVAYHHPPELIIQDELHLIEGPVGSMVGLYETAFDYLCSEHPDAVMPKYIASTATVRRAEEQTKCTFNRSLAMFPPHGESYGNRFFVMEREAHALDSQTENGDDKPGKLYMGVLTPGRGSHTPAIRMWSRNATTVWEQRDNQPRTKWENIINKFWTQTGYFNASKELASFSATYSQDIADRMFEIGGANHRNLSEDGKIEMSSREVGSASATMPAMLDRLDTKYVYDQTLTAPNCYNQKKSPDSLMGTAMIGTGLDVPRINLMTVFGQPKTMASYIQATGRSGRTDAALVVTFFQAAKPRDLSHYESFMGSHRQIQRFVEAPTVYPFSVKNMESNIGPVLTYMLRNKIKKIRNGGRWEFQRTFHVPSTPDDPINWGWDNSASEMENHSGDQDILDLLQVMEERAQDQHLTRRPKSYSITPNHSAYGIAESKIQDWSRMATICNQSQPPQPLDYVQYWQAGQQWHSVVLGDVKHQEANMQPGIDIQIVFENAPQSLRDVETETHISAGEIFTASSSRPTRISEGVRLSQYVIGMGPGHIIQPSKGVSRIIPSSQIGIFPQQFTRTWYQNAIENVFRIEDRKITATLASLLSLSNQPVTEAALFRPPTNEDLRVLDAQAGRNSNPATNQVRQTDDEICKTNAFPNYYVCTNKNNHDAVVDGNVRNYDIMFKHQGEHPHCPICRSPPYEKISSTRFLTSCPSGHMDDINWKHHVHKTHPHSSGACNPAATMPAVDNRLQNPDIFIIRFNPPDSSALEYMMVQCPRCVNTSLGTGSRSMSDIYSDDHHCNGRFPEEEQILGSGLLSVTQDCTQTQPSMKVIQKSASYLRNTEIYTMLSVGDNTSRIDKLFQTQNVDQACISFERTNGEINDIQKLKQFLRANGPDPQNPRWIPLFEDTEITDLLANSQETLRAIRNRDAPIPDNYDDLLTYEFQELLTGSVRGAPPPVTPRIRTRFQMNRNHFQSFPFTMNGTPKILLAASVDDLTTVTIQTGYRRDKKEDSTTTTPQHVVERKDIGMVHGDKRWYPAVEFQGEGIFIRFKNEDETTGTDRDDLAWTDPLQGDRADAWRNRAVRNQAKYNNFAFRNTAEVINPNPPPATIPNPNPPPATIPNPAYPQKMISLSKKYELEPEFVWWHTFAHALVKTIQDSAGYSNAAIKERVYYEKRDDGMVRGGILLYVSQQGVDGTMGGLVGLIPTLDAYIRSAVDMITTCSADPICEHANLTPQDTPYIGSACFGCVMNSETSCDIRNFYLDRKLFQENRIE